MQRAAREGGHLAKGDLADAGQLTEEPPPAAKPKFRHLGLVCLSPPPSLPPAQPLSLSVGLSPSLPPSFSLYAHPYELTSSATGPSLTPCPLARRSHSLSLHLVPCPMHTSDELRCPTQPGPVLRDGQRKQHRADQHAHRRHEPAKTQSHTPRGGSAAAAAALVGDCGLGARLSPGRTRLPDPPPATSPAASFAAAARRRPLHAQSPGRA